MKEENCHSVPAKSGAGFIGSILCKAFLCEWHEVFCQGKFYAASNRIDASLVGNPQFAIIHHDVTLPTYLEAVQICNPARYASTFHCNNEAMRTTIVGLHGATNLLGTAKCLSRRA